MVYVNDQLLCTVLYFLKQVMFIEIQLYRIGHMLFP